MKDWKAWAIIALAAWCAWLTFNTQKGNQCADVGASVESHLQGIVDDYVKENRLGDKVPFGKRPMSGVIENHFWEKYK